jgi:hypothetical protein
MSRKKNTNGGGSKTNLNGLGFEKKTNLLELINENNNYELTEFGEVVNENRVVAKYFEKHQIYSEILKPNGLNYKNILSKKLLPDSALLVGGTIFIIEKKFQNGAGSVDEKLQTCDFKKRQYEKLFNPLGINVEYYYLLNNFFNKECYKDVFEYIESVGCRYFFEKIPLDKIGL